MHENGNENVLHLTNELYYNCLVSSFVFFKLIIGFALNQMSEASYQGCNRMAVHQNGASLSK